jgi:hypothetical protein
MFLLFLVRQGTASNFVSLAFTPAPNSPTLDFLAIDDTGNHRIFPFSLFASTSGRAFHIIHPNTFFVSDNVRIFPHWHSRHRAAQLLLTVKNRHFASPTHVILLVNGSLSLDDDQNTTFQVTSHHGSWSEFALSARNTSLFIGSIGSVTNRRLPYAAPAVDLQFEWTVTLPPWSSFAAPLYFSADASDCASRARLLSSPSSFPIADDGQWWMFSLYGVVLFLPNAIVVALRRVCGQMAASFSVLFATLLLNLGHGALITAFFLDGPIPLIAAAACYALWMVAHVAGWIGRMYPKPKTHGVIGELRADRHFGGAFREDLGQPRAAATSGGPRAGMARGKPRGCAHDGAP